MIKTKIIDFVTSSLEEISFEELLAQFDLTPEEVFNLLYENGHIDEDVLETLSDTTYE